MEHPFDVSVLQASSSDRDTTAKQFDGVVGSAPVSDVGFRFREPEGIRRLVFE